MTIQINIDNDYTVRWIVTWIEWYIWWDDRILIRIWLLNRVTYNILLELKNTLDRLIV